MMTELVTRILWRCDVVMYSFAMATTALAATVFIWHVREERNIFVYHAAAVLIAHGEMIRRLHISARRFQRYTYFSGGASVTFARMLT